MRMVDDYIQIPSGKWVLREDTSKLSRVGEQSGSGNVGDLGDVGFKSAGLVGDLALPLLIDLREIEAGEVEWVWKGWIPKGFVSLMTGDPDAGKTYSLLSLAATLAEGGWFPDDTKADPRRIVYVDGENGPQETKRRLQSQGFTAFERFRLLSNVNDKGKVVPLSLDRHLGSLMAAIADFQPDWVIIDPLVAFHGRREIIATEVRQLIRELAGLAERFAVAVTVVQHPNKTFQAPELYRVRGSLDFVAAVRAVLNVILLEDGTRVLVVEKLNLDVKPEPIGFRIVNRRVEWTGIVKLPSHTTEEGQARDFLQEYLAGGPVPASEVYTAAKAEGISHHTLQRAKSKLGVKSRKVSATGPWEWVLPKQDRQPSEVLEPKVAKVAKDASEKKWEIEL